MANNVQRLARWLNGGRSGPLAAAVAGWFGLALGAPAGAQDAAACGTRDLALVNGVIHTMDAQDTIVSSVLVKAGRFAALDPDPATFDDCTDVIDARGRTVIPGLIDNHVHYIRIANRPGHDLRALEVTFTGGRRAGGDPRQSGGGARPAR